MCGIAGIIQLNPQQQAPSDILQRMLRAMIHRGPDEDGTLHDGPLSMGMRRLSIIDLTDGKQPISDESGRYTVVFNGEIYNYRELRQELISRGHVFRTQSDTEVIVHLYEEQGPNCIEHLRGMFCFAIWDQVERELFIARDRMGIKPLYYAERDNAIIFASEIKCLLEHPAVHAEIDLQSLSHYLSLKYVPSPRTMFAGIRSLPPGHWMRVRQNRIETQRYWNMSFEKPRQVKSEAEYIDELAGLLRESVKLRLRADVPFGAFLSGGVDSSTIVALMAEQMSEPVKTFSVGFEESEGQDELPYARQVAERFGCDHHTLSITSRDFLDLAEKVLWHLDQPIADQATVATYMVSKLARRHVKMVLTGEGGDELFAGYARYAGERYSPWFRYLPGSLGKLARVASRHLPGMRRGKIAINALTIRDEATRMANWFPMFNDETKVELIGKDWLEDGWSVADVFQEHLDQCDARDPIDRMLYVDSKLWLPDYLLLRGDKLSMAMSLEARVPLLDHKLVEFAAQLPSEYKLRGKERKYLLKRVAEKWIPPEIIHRKKQGFPIPIERWLRKEARPMMRDLLSRESLQRRGLFRVAYVEKMMKQHEIGYADHSTQLWGLMSVEMWIRKFMDGTKEAASTAAALVCE